MTTDEALREAASSLGVQQEYWDIFGRLHATPPATNAAILDALGVSDADPTPLIARRAATHPELPAPARAVTPPRCAGLGIMLHGLRSRRNWGCGDFRDLTDLIAWAVPALRIGFIALNPLHAIHNRRPFNTSPYLPNSVFYRNFIYLDVEAVPGYEGVDSATLAAIERARNSETIEYETVAALKRETLAGIFHRHPPTEECLDWIAREGELLRLYATYCALDEHIHAGNPAIWIWPDWPDAFRNPANPAVARFASEHEAGILFHSWLQWLIDCQISDVQRFALETGMPIGLYHDLALATDRCGSDLWAHRDFFVPGCRVGSPPDDFSPKGQDWSFPPPATDRHREDNYRLFTASIRNTLRHGGALRLDHVMRLFRLFWIPPGHEPADGAYVRDRADETLRVLTAESTAARAVIVGEDLGTVEPEVRTRLAEAGILSYRLLYFERDSGRFRSPAEYPEQALVSTTTHDLPTIAGFWTGADIEARRQAGIIDRQGFDEQLAARTRDRQALLEALFSEQLLPREYERDASRIPELTGEIHYAVMGYLARTPSAMWLINQEDLTKEPAQQNLPGTVAEFPNWSRKMRWSVEELATLPVARDCAAMLRGWIESSSRAI